MTDKNSPNKKKNKIPKPYVIDTQRVPRQPFSEMARLNSDPVFNFRYFHYKPIKCKDVQFNNHFEDSEHSEYIGAFILTELLKTISSFTISEITSTGIRESLHIHALSESKVEILKKILIEYNFNIKDIDSWIEGASIYQLALPSSKYPARLVAIKCDNVFAPLFMDVNHHLYLNSEKVEESRSIEFNYSECPLYIDCKCSNPASYRCFCDIYLDYSKFNETYGYSHNI